MSSPSQVYPTEDLSDDGDSSTEGDALQVQFAAEAEKKRRLLKLRRKVMANFATLHASVSFWRKKTFEKPPPIWRKLPTIDSGLYDGSFPHVGGSIAVRTDDLGFSFVLDVRLCTRTLALLNIDEHENTFEAILEVALEWEVTHTQYDVCQEFWDTFRPNLHFENAVALHTEKPEPIFDDHSVPTENGCLMLRDERDGKQTILRHFEYRKRTQRKFRQPLDLVHFPFDCQTLPITFYSEKTIVYGRPFHLRLKHPMAKDDFAFDDVADGAHIFEKNADCVDDMQTETLFALEGPEMLPELQAVPERGSAEARLRPRHDQYAVLIFVSRQYKSTIYNIYLPLAFMYILSFLAFFIPPCAVVDRASVSLTLLLTTVALKTYMSEKLPSVPYCSAAENFLLYITVTLLLQSILMAVSASSCFRYGAPGQFGADLRVLDHDDERPYDDDIASDPNWDCRTEENNYDFWCFNRRARIQSYFDICSIWISICIGLFTATKHVVLRLWFMYLQLFEIHRHKFRSEYPELWKKEVRGDTTHRQKRRVESSLCFFASRHADDADAFGPIRLIFRLLEPVFWQIHLFSNWLDGYRCRRSSIDDDPTSPFSATSPPGTARSSAGSPTQGTRSTTMTTTVEAAAEYDHWSYHHSSPWLESPTVDAALRLRFCLQEQDLPSTTRR